MNTVNDVDRLYNAIEINEKTFSVFSNRCTVLWNTTSK